MAKRSEVAVQSAPEYLFASAAVALAVSAWLLMEAMVGDDTWSIIASGLVTVTFLSLGSRSGSRRAVRVLIS